ncbi:MAG: DUF1998 domain-containing protein [Thauera sp.]|jgi:hypothetical protein|nr:DUF1998 domain-containing protein [Thauera sp.]
MSDELIPIRLSHMLGHSGPGAIVRGAKGLAVVQDIRQWTDRQGAPAGKQIPYVERVRAALGLTQQLCEPPTARKSKSGRLEGHAIPAMRFPSWARCPGCNALYWRPWRSAADQQEPHCSSAGCQGKRLEQLTWVLVHQDGHLADVPFRYLAHQEAREPAQQACRSSDQLELVEPAKGKRRLRCRACNAASDFRGDEQLPFLAHGSQPWTRGDLPPQVQSEALPQLPPEQEDGASLAKVLSINDARTYLPDTVSVLIIPPESRIRKGTVVDLLYRNSAERKKIDDARNPLARKSVIAQLASQYRCQPGDIEHALSDLERGYPLYGENLTPGQLRESEFDAFLEIFADQRDDEDLVTRNQGAAWRALGEDQKLEDDKRSIIDGIENLVRVERLKAVRIFQGFSRLANPGEERMVPPDIVGQSDWLPAIELYGEGIFITLNEQRLARWEKQPAVAGRLQGLILRHRQSPRQEPNPLTARFMLLHTLSHLLMRQIESEGGYPAASLNERIYCSQRGPDKPKNMAGILIHVAVPDLAGSLGGLAELAEPRRFLGILVRALEHARWCSLDPVCSEHEGQGPELLNRAACHACTLVPEPACEHGNALLDRSFVKGAAEDGLQPFFGGGWP